MLRISVSLPSASGQWVLSSCQRSFGLFGLEADVAALGAFVRLRRGEASGGQGQVQIVDTARLVPWRCWRRSLN
jgi:hypothetical protein